MSVYATPGVTAADLVVGIKVNIDEAIYMLDPQQLPLLNGLAADGDTVLSQDSIDQVKHEWQDDTLLAPRSHLAATSTAEQGTITVTTGDGVKFATGDLLSVRTDAQTTDYEIMKVTGISTDTLTVMRAFQTGGTATALDTGDVVMGIGTAMGEGATPQAFRATDRVNRYNYAQIFGPYGIEMTGTARVVPRYGVPDEWAYQLTKRIYEAAQAREQALMYGRRTIDADSRTMGGLAEFLSSQAGTAATTGAITVSDIEGELQACFNNGGVPDRLIMNPNVTPDLSDRYNTTIVRTDLDDARRGRVRVAWLQTEFADIPIVRSRWCASQDVFGIRRDSCTRMVLRPMIFEMLAKTRDADSAMFLCEETLKVKGASHQFRMGGWLGYTSDGTNHY